MEKFLRRRQVVELTGLSDSFFKKAAMKGSGPIFVKVGRAVLYSEQDVLDWLQSYRKDACEKNGGND